MRYIRLLLSFFLSAFLLLSIPLTAYAKVSSSLDASRSDALRPPVASGSDALPSDPGIQDTPLSDVPYGGNDEFESTVDLTDVRAVYWYYDMHGVLKSLQTYLKSDGRFSIGPASDIASPLYLEFYIDSGARPPYGKYNCRFKFTSDTGGHTYQKVNFYSAYKYDNADTVGERYEVKNFASNSGDCSGMFSFDFGRVTALSIQLVSSGFKPPLGGWFSLSFNRLGSDVSVDTGTVGGGYTSDDAMQDLAGNSAQQVEQGDTIIELIKNTIQTISSQLTAFWNQLAGEFTNLYNKMNQQHSEQLEADRQNTDDLISNQDENTDTVVNGYDNSGMNADNDRLNSSLTEYGQAEDSLMDDVNDHISGIDFDYNFDSIISVIGSVSDFFQGLYERSGQFQIVINVCLILSLASCAVGIYRLKGGG